MEKRIVQCQTEENAVEKCIFLLENETSPTPNRNECQTNKHQDRFLFVASGRRFCHNLKTNERFRQKCCYSVCLFIVKLIQGLAAGMIGPSFIDIRMISGTDLDKGAWILTSKSVGFGFGSALQGIFYGRVNNKLTFGASMCVFGITASLIPWCRGFEAMTIAFVMHGIMIGILASGISTEIFLIWGKKSRLVLLQGQVVLAAGNALSPLVVAPFLIEHQTAAMSNISSVEAVERTGNITYVYSGPHSSEKLESNIFIPYSIMAGISLFSAISFFITYIKYDHEFDGRQRNDAPDVSENDRSIPKCLKLFIISIIGIKLFIYNGLDETFTDLLSTYCVRYFQWLKRDGALITFVFFVFKIVGRIVSVFLSGWMNTILYTVVNCILIFLSMLGMLLISLYDVDVLAWLLVSLLGFAKSCIFPLSMIWVNEYVTPMTGRISAFFYICLMLGSALNPILIGHAMENSGIIWFCFLLLIDSIAILLFLAIAVLTTRYIVRHFGRTYYKKKTKGNNIEGRQNGVVM